MLVLIGVVILILAYIGGAIRGVLGVRKATTQFKSTPPLIPALEIITVTATLGMEVTPIPSILFSILPVPTGIYYILITPKNQSKLYIANPAFLVSWACMNSGDIPIKINRT